MYRITIVSPLFEGTSLVKQHRCLSVPATFTKSSLMFLGGNRMVHQSLEAEIGAMHGFSLRTFTPDQWTRLNAPVQD
jgi:stress-induced morphogen